MFLQMEISRRYIFWVTVSDLVAAKSFFFFFFLGVSDLQAFLAFDNWHPSGILKTGRKTRVRGVPNNIVYTCWISEPRYFKFASATTVSMLADRLRRKGAGMESAQ